MKQLLAKVAVTVVCILCLATEGRGEAQTEPTLKAGNARVVLVGDSITGQSRNRAKGFANTMDIALLAAYPGSKNVLIALGGSGQSVSSWMGIEENSRTKNQLLDIPKIDVKESLDSHASVLVVMLGMNDVIAPYIDESESSLDQWIGRYEKLITALQKRTTPTVLALGSVPLCTEDLDSPKNRLIDRMNLRVRALAERIGAKYIPVSELEKQVLKEGRALNRDFHLSYDFVHPNDIGHLVIAMAMLKALDAVEAAQWLSDKQLDPILKQLATKQKDISYDVSPVIATDSKEAAARQIFRVHYNLPKSNSGNAAECEVKIIPSEGWSVSPERCRGDAGEFTLSGIPDRLSNEFVLQAKSGTELLQTTGVIPAPWLLAASVVQPQWNGEEFQTEQGRTPLDEAIEREANFTNGENGISPALRWVPYFASVNYLGGENLSNIDFSAIVHAKVYEAGYGVRWIYSENERSVKLNISSLILSGRVHLTIWENGKKCYQGDITKEDKRSNSVAITLHKGWNTLAFKANHRSWLWQFCLALKGEDGDVLSDIRYSITYPDSTVKKQVSIK